MILPTIHLNGTSKGDLLDGWLKMRHALQAALKAMYNEGPNARDYYVQGPSVFTQAQAEHEERTGKVIGILAEIDQIVDHIANAEGGRP